LITDVDVDVEIKKRQQKNMTGSRELQVSADPLDQIYVEM
jgi:hypothetical protein